MLEAQRKYLLTAPGWYFLTDISTIAFPNDHGILLLETNVFELDPDRLTLLISDETLIVPYGTHVHQDNPPRMVVWVLSFHPNFR